MTWTSAALIFVVALFLYAGWRVWREWIAPTRHLDRLVAALNANEAPATFLIGEHGRMRRIGLALEEIWLRQKQLIRRAEEGEFGVEAITAAMADGVVVADGDRRVQLMNRAFREMFGVDGKGGEMTLLEAARDVTADRLLAETLAQGTTQRGAITLPADRHIEIAGEPMRGRDGAISGAVLLFRDVSELRRTETMRRDFVANVSHELRTPLSILRGYLETLLENPKQPPAELLRIFEVMERHSNRLNLLVNDVLDLARLEGPGASLDLTTVRPGDFLRGVARDWEKRIEAKKLHLALEVPEDLPLLQADEGRLQEVLYNLLDNAVKYSQEGGRIVIRAEVVENEFCLGVSDDGVGISPRDLPRIFERFFRADKSRQSGRGGTGLGLAIVKHIAQLHGGRVLAESEIGRGTTVQVRLPLKRQEAVANVMKS